MKNVEVELRSFISEDKYNELLNYFNLNAKLLNKDYQETYYFDAKEDLRIQKNNFFSKIWMKKGKVHDETREEIEVKFSKDDFDKLEKLFLSVGLNVQIKWFRDRHEFDWNGIIVCVDYTKGYGYILELEMMSDENEKDKTLEIIRNKFDELGIIVTPRKEFDDKYNYYKENWKNLIL